MKRICAIILCLALLTTVVGAAGGSRDDPVITQSYLTKIWEPKFLESARTAVRKALLPVYVSAFRTVTERLAVQRQKNEQSVSRQTLGQLLLKKGDVLLPMAGCRLLLVDGAVTASPELIDVTHGLPAGTVMEQKTLYMQTDRPSSGLTVTTPSAELQVNGSYTLRSAAGTDYGSLALALQKMGLFKGVSDGFKLRGTATRAQGLVMFLRLMGMEDEALACKDVSPFTDVNGHWAKPYIAYAFKKGLTTGTTATTFSPDAPVTAQHYLTFLMRALHYQEGTEFSFKTVLTDSAAKKLFGDGELKALTATGFNREQMAYLSYYALACADGQSGELLLDRLTTDGTVKDAAAGLALARGGRLG